MQFSPLYYVFDAPQDLARSNPAALSRLSGFKIIRDGYGCLEWQQPVDVRGLDLEGIVQIERGKEVYRRLCLLLLFLQRVWCCVVNTAV